MRQNISESDLNTFKIDSSDTKCDQNNNEINPIDSCIAVKNLVHASQYYSSLNIINNAEDQNVFIHFIRNTYTHLLNDYNHLVTKHNNLDQINKAIINNKEYGKCDIKTCSFTARHHQTKTQNTDSRKALDNVLNFYKITMDSLHFYLVHLFECGLRTNTINNSDAKRELKPNKDNEYYDQSFAHITRIINERKRISDSFNRFKNNNKFNIGFIKQTGHSSVTFMDAFMEHISQTIIETIKSNKFNQYILDEEYDTDCIQMDVTDFRDSELENAICHFVKIHKLKSSSFSVGLTFYYWEQYKNVDKLDYNRSDNVNDHSGYSIKDLCVNPKYANFKEEISHYTYFDMTEYNENVIPKITEYMNTNAVKQSNAAGD
eukprot:382004_1